MQSSANVVATIHETLANISEMCRCRSARSNVYHRTALVSEDTVEREDPWPIAFLYTAIAAANATRRRDDENTRTRARAGRGRTHHI